MKNLTIDIEEENIESFDYQLDRIKQAILNGFTSGEGWDISEVYEVKE